MASITEVDAAAFWQHVEMCNTPRSDCWLWRGPVDREGRPTFGGERAERTAWTLARPLADPLGERQLQPRCATGAGCVNPDHWMIETRPSTPAAQPSLKAAPRPARAATPAAAVEQPAQPEASRPAAVVVNEGLQRCPHCQKGAYTRKQITAILRLNFCDLCKPERRELMPAIGAKPKKPAPMVRAAEASQKPQIVEFAQPGGQGVDGILLTGQLLGVVASYLAQNPGRLDVVRGALEDVARTVGRA